jgi:NAD(P)-dependent dehydrogenase (short-subunit alcohol dehydrogenase family)
MKDYQAPANLLQERVILVTGAGQGIGQEAARAYAAHGATVILMGKSKKKLEKVYDQIEQAGHPQPAIFPLDLAKAEEAEFTAMAQGIREQLGRLDGILHNAAMLESLGPIQDETLETWLKVLRVNLAAPFALTRACLPLLKAAPDASVIFTSDEHGHEPTAFWGAFAVSKAGLEAQMRIWAQELETLPSPRFNALIPFPVTTPQRIRTHPGEKPGFRPLPDVLMPWHLYLMGPDSRAVRGQVIDCRKA